ncbi:MAG: DUF3822 family protein [Paramuribaculum sp.]|nr:DUF3822 family protein [Paramuribaculum sp.]
MNQTLDTVTQPELWKMALMIGPKSLDVALYPPLARDEMIWHSYAYEEPTLQAIEEIVYGNPPLLADYKSVVCIIDYTPAVVVPAEADAEQAAAIYNATLGEDSDEDVALYGCGEGVSVAIRQPRQIADFITRTFFNVKMMSAAANRIAYFRACSQKGTAVYAPVEGDRTRVVAVSDGNLLLANDFAARTPSDAAYYIMWAIGELGLDAAETPVYAGSIGMRHSELHELLSKYITSASALPMPPLRYRGSRATLEAPFDFLILPLCE